MLPGSSSAVITTLSFFHVTEMWHTWCMFPVCLILSLVTFPGQRRKWEVTAMQTLFLALRKFIITTKKPSNSLILTICQIQNLHHSQFPWNAWVHTFIFKAYLKIPHLNLVGLLPFHFPLHVTSPVKFLNAVSLFNTTGFLPSKMHSHQKMISIQWHMER